MVEPVLKKGSNAPAVRDLQEALSALGHYHGLIDGAFGDATEAAVKAFQQARKISADGIVGKVTWITIDEADQSEPVLRIGSTGLPVRRAQKRMSLVGFDVGGVDARYGPKTHSAVKDLQERFQVTIDGVVGPQTWAIIDALEDEGAIIDGVWRTKDRLSDACPGMLHVVVEAGLPLIGFLQGTGPIRSDCEQFHDGSRRGEQRAGPYHSHRATQSMGTRNGPFNQG